MIFYKYQGAGNDFLIADNRDGHLTETGGVLYCKETGWSKPVAEICDRRYGVGADGLMLLENSDKYDFRMAYYNSDGFSADSECHLPDVYPADHLCMVLLEFIQKQCCR